MAEYCNYCSKEMFGRIKPPDIDVFEIFKELEERHARLVCCEGCDISWIGRINNELKVQFSDPSKKKPQRWVNYSLRNWKKHSWFFVKK